MSKSICSKGVSSSPQVFLLSLTSADPLPLRLSRQMSQLGTAKIASRKPSLSPHLGELSLTQMLGKLSLLFWNVAPAYQFPVDPEHFI